MCLMPRASQKDWPPSYNMAASYKKTAAAYKKTAAAYKKTLIPYETGHLGTTNAQYQHVFVSKCTCCVRHTSSESVEIIGLVMLEEIRLRDGEDHLRPGEMSLQRRNDLLDDENDCLDRIEERVRSGEDLLRGE